MERNCDLSAARTSSQKLRVDGVRRVWGTLKETTVSSTIIKFSTSASLVIKRKTTRNDIGEIERWWYVLHDALRVPEGKWVGLKMHTGWKLELCFRPGAAAAYLGIVEGGCWCGHSFRACALQFMRMRSYCILFVYDDGRQ